MLYRIAIYRPENGKLVFDRYASDDELARLHIAPDGRVEEAVWVDQSRLNGRAYITRETYAVGVKQVETGEYTVPAPTNPRKSEFLVWEDVSFTHEVEWGFEFEGKEYYENGVYRHTNCKEVSGDYRAVTGVFDLLTTINYLSNYAGEIICIGNIHEEEK